MHINIYINIRIGAGCGNTAASVYYGVVCCVRVHWLYATNCRVPTAEWSCNLPLYSTGRVCLWCCYCVCVCRLPVCALVLSLIACQRWGRFRAAPRLHSRVVLCLHSRRLDVALPAWLYCTVSGVVGVVCPVNTESETAWILRIPMTSGPAREAVLASLSTHIQAVMKLYQLFQLSVYTYMHTFLLGGCL